MQEVECSSSKGLGLFDEKLGNGAEQNKKINGSN
tara:strand:+ start:269 stop:370 length:102 start_codon:yes stop_codon:yes gene_type:complete